jgi:hypothetical protein
MNRDLWHKESFLNGTDPDSRKPRRNGGRPLVFRSARKEGNVRQVKELRSLKQMQGRAWRGLCMKTGNTHLFSFVRGRWRATDEAAPLRCQYPVWNVLTLEKTSEKTAVVDSLTASRGIEILRPGNGETVARKILLTELATARLSIL